MIKYTQLIENLEEHQPLPDDVSHHEFREETTPQQRKNYAGVYQDFIKKQDKQAGAFLHASRLPRNLASHLRKHGSVSLIGQEAPTTHDLAMLAQIHRDPRVESMHMIYTKGNKIVGHNTVSSRMPAIVMPFKTGVHMTDNYMQMQDDMKHFGADSYYILHNHPSGRSEPSPADINLTKEVAASVPGFKSHVVIDNSEYHTIDAKGNTEHVQLNHPIHYDLENPKHHLKTHEVLGMSVTGAKDVAEVGKHFEHPDHVTLFGTRGIESKISSIVSMPSHLLETNDATTTNRIRHFARHAGTTRQFLVVPTDKDRYKYLHHIKNGTLTDIVSKESGEGVRHFVPGHDEESTLGIGYDKLKQYGSLTNK